MSEQTKPFTTAGRTVIPCYCWIQNPETGKRCRLRPHADGNHRNMIAHEEWPHRGPEPQ